MTAAVPPVPPAPHVELERVAHDSVQALLRDVTASDLASQIAADRLRRAVQTAVAGGATWQQVGDQLGTSRQGAHRRFHHSP